MDLNRLRYIGDRPVGPDHPVYVTAEIGINHNGNLEDALALIDVAAEAGCDAVKFQKRTPEVCFPTSPSATPVTRSACRARSPLSPWARASSSGTSPSTGPTGVRTRRRRSNR